MCVCVAGRGGETERRRGRERELWLHGEGFFCFLVVFLAVFLGETYCGAVPSCSFE